MTRRPAVALAAAGAIVALAAGCGGSSSSSKPKVTAPPVTDAVAVRNRLLHLVKKHASDKPGDDGTFGAVSAWQKDFPKLATTGAATAADASTVSVARGAPADAAQAASATNPYRLAFAVADTAGACAGGLAAGFPKPSTVTKVALKSGSACTAAAVLAPQP